MSNTPEGAAPRSNFVTALAWTFIVFGGFATAISLLQSILFLVLIPAGEMRAAMREAEQVQALPPFAIFMLEHMQWVVGMMFVVCVFTFVSSVGLLKRRNWARINFIGLMVLGCVFNLAGMAAPYLMFSSMPPIPSSAPQDFQDNFRLMTAIMTGFSIVIGIVFSVLMGWIARRLMSPEIKREFNAP